jgi:hypothetical protein
VIALAVERATDGEVVVTVLPITHNMPEDPASAVEIPAAIKKHLGLDEERSWVMVSEGDQFVWPGYDLRKIRRTGKFDYGFLPPRFFDTIVAALRAWHERHRTVVVPRT